MNDHRNTILAVILSGMVLIGWQYFFVVPQMDKQQAAQKAQQVQQAQQPQQPPLPARRRPARQPRRSPARPLPERPRRRVRRWPSRVKPRLPPRRASKIDTQKVSGSIALKGGRIDDISLNQYRVTVDPKSPPVTLFSPSGAPNPYYAEFGWFAPTGATVKLADASTEWKQEGGNTLW